jgi:hypothetical protein
VFDGWRNSCAYIGIHDEYSEGEYITVFGKYISDAEIILYEFLKTNVLKPP